MEFVNKGDFGNDTVIVSINVPRIMMKSFVAGKLKELKKEDPALAFAINKIKKVKFMTISNNGKSNLSEKINTYLAKNNFEEIMSLNSEGAKISN